MASRVDRLAGNQPGLAAEGKLITIQLIQQKLALSTRVRDRLATGLRT